MTDTTAAAIIRGFAKADPEDEYFFVLVDKMIKDCKAWVKANEPPPPPPPPTREELAERYIRASISVYTRLRRPQTDAMVAAIMAKATPEEIESYAVLQENWRSTDPQFAKTCRYKEFDLGDL